MTCSKVVDHLAVCESCCKEAMKQLYSKAGATKSPAKSKAARLNGLKGGRPRKEN